MEGFEPVLRRGRILKIGSFEGSGYIAGRVKVEEAVDASEIRPLPVDGWSISQYS